jgi:hypothetical protein
MVHIFAYQKSLFCAFLVGLGMETVGIWHGHMVNFSRFGLLFQEKSGNSGPELSAEKNPSFFEQVRITF